MLEVELLGIFSIIFSQENKLELINMFGCLGFKGKINLKNPERTFVIVDNYYRGKKYFGKLIAGKSDGNFLLPNLIIQFLLLILLFF